eukprot:TRINITY_DN5814_c0_g2_i1.p1 TRINITY_DN5814_c0_g2~~TRINITY_DN5814_c0_g2_i1.p1  ORF type:complete len:403 (-),score=92.48 TRINITY_DN5814_c0_g2_i1:51-1259(-)
MRRWWSVFFLDLAVGVHLPPAEINDAVRVRPNGNTSGFEAYAVNASFSDANTSLLQANGAYSTSPRINPKYLAQNKSIASATKGVSGVGKQMNGGGVHCAKICSDKAQELRDQADKMLKDAEKLRQDSMAMLKEAMLHSCLGWSAPDGKWKGKGGNCARWGWSINWCFVDKDYKGMSHEFVRSSDEYKDRWYAPCELSEDDTNMRKAAAGKLKEAATLVLKALELLKTGDGADTKCIKELKQKAAKMRKNAENLNGQAESAMKKADIVIKEALRRGCNGWDPTNGTYLHMGSTCQTWGFTTTWCWVEKNFNGPGIEFVTEAPDLKGKFYAPCYEENEKRVSAMRKEAKDMKEKARQLRKQAMKFKKKATDKAKQAAGMEQSLDACQMKYPNAEKVKDILGKK